jgi:hypothetical protein
MSRYLISLVSTFFAGFLLPGSTIAIVTLPVGVLWKRFRFQLLVVGLSHALLLGTSVFISGIISIPLQVQKCADRSVAYQVDKTSRGFKLYEYSKSTSSQVPGFPTDEQICNDDTVSVYFHYYLGRLVTYILFMIPIHASVFGLTSAVRRLLRKVQSANYENNPSC